MEPVVWRAIAVQMRLRRSSLNSDDAAGWEEMNAFARLAPSTSKRLSFERSSLVVAQPRSCISVLRVTVSGLILLRAGIFLERIRANAVERRQWFTVVGEVCCLCVVKGGRDQRCGWDGDATDGEGWEWAGRHFEKDRAEQDLKELESSAESSNVDEKWLNV